MKSIKKQTRSSKRRNLIIALSLLVVLVGAGTAFALTRQSQQPTSSPPASDSTPDETSNPTRSEEESKQDAANKQEFLDNQTKQPPAQPKPTPTADTISVSAKNDGSSVTVITKLPSVNLGTCTLTITNGSKTINKTADVIYAPEYSTCAGFSVAKSEAGTGTWIIKLSVASPGSAQLTKTIKLNVM